MSNRLFDIENSKDTAFLHKILEKFVAENAPDEDVIQRIQEVYDSSCWFSVISFAEQVIYG